jgi:hypothetical protein
MVAPTCRVASPRTSILQALYTWFNLVVSRLTALAVSMLEPPPTATYASNGPCSPAWSIAAYRLASVGSTWAPS